jgi:hypothetical protein
VKVAQAARLHRRIILRQQGGIRSLDHFGILGRAFARVLPHDLPPDLHEYLPGIRSQFPKYRIIHGGVGLKCSAHEAGVTDRHDDRATDRHEQQKGDGNGHNL